MTSHPESPASLADLEQAARALVGQHDEWFLGPVLRKDFQRFALAVGDLDPLSFDEDAARSAGHPGLVAPPLYLSSVMGWRAGPPEAGLREDGLSQEDLLPVPVPGLRVMGGGQEVELLQPVHEGVEVTLRREFTDVRRREGRSGPLLVFSVLREYVDARGEVLVRVQENFIAR